MEPEALKSLKNVIIRHEGNKLFPYADTTGHMTIGIGRNLTVRGLYPNEPEMLLDNDLNYFIPKLKETIPFFKSLDSVRQIVLVDMCFNLGLKGLLEFKKMLEAIKRRDWTCAAKEILESKAAIQASNRYQNLAHMMQTGELND